MISKALAVGLAVVVWLALVSACAGNDDAEDGTISPSPATATPGAATPDIPVGDALIMYRDSVGDLIVRDLAGGASYRQTIDYNNETIVAATCSPDGTKIAYLKQFFDKTNRTLIVRGEGGPADPIELSPRVQDITWSPDGTRIAIAEWDGIEQVGALSYIDVASGEITELTGGDDYPGGLTWSPDGSQLAYFLQDIGGEGSSIYVLPVDGGDPEKVTDDEEIDWLDPNWSPDGDSIFVSGIAAEGTQIYRVDPKAHEATAVTTSADIFKRGPEVSPDGSLIAYTGSIILPGVSAVAVALHTFGIFIVNADGSDEHALTADPRLNPGAQVDPFLDAFLMGWCSPGAWLDDLWTEEESEAAQ